MKIFNQHNSTYDISSILKIRRLGIWDILSLPRIWRVKAFRYGMLRKKAKKENPPGINLLWIAFLQAIVSKDRALIDEAAKYVEGNVEEDVLLRIHGNALCHIGYYDEGVAQLRKAVSINPNHEYTKEFICYLTKPENRYERLILCNRILKDKPKDTFSLSIITDILFQYGQRGKAENHLDILLQSAPNSFVVRELSGDLFYFRENYNRALEEYDIAFKLGNRTAYVLAQLSGCYYFLEKYPLAKKAALKALKKNPDNMNAKLLLEEAMEERMYGVECFNNNCYDSAIPWLKVEADREKKNGVATLYCAAVETMKSADEIHLKNAIAEVRGNVPDDVITRVSGLSKFKIGQESQGIEEMRKALAMNPSLDNKKCLAACLRDKEEYSDQAKKLYSEILSVNDRDYEALWSLGLLYGEEPEKALVFFRKALEVQPNDWKMHYDIGYALNKLNRPEDAIHSFEQARKLCSNDNPSDISVGLSESYLKLNKKELALQEAERALVENPDSEEGKKLLNELRNL